MRSQRIVYIEDCPHDQLLASRILSKLDISPSVTMLDDGESALLHLKRLIDVPDLVIVDLNIPKLKGTDIIKELKKLPRFLTVPFVVMTGSNHDADIQEAYAAGAVSFIPKPDPLDPIGWGRELKCTVYYWLQVNQTKLAEHH